MFGYVIADLARLDEAQRTRYKSVYCGLCRALFHKDAIVCKKGEYDVEHLLIMSLIFGVLAIWNSSKEGLKQI